MKMTILMLGITLTLAGCRQYEHKQEQKKIRNERVQKEKETADLNDAVKAVDEAGWDSTIAHKQFMDNAIKGLERNSVNLYRFEQDVRQGRRKVPLQYRRRIMRLRQRNTALEQRLAHYPFTGDQSTWEDSTRLYNYDLDHLTKDIQKLTGK